MRKSYLLSTLVLTLLFIGNTLQAQDFSNKGKNFWISYPEHIDGTTSIMGVYITSNVNTSGVITVNGTNIPFTVTANNITTTFLGPGGTGSNTYIHLGNLQDGIKVGAAVHVTALQPVVVYAHIIHTSRSGASLMLPTTVWGKEYIAPTYPNSGGNGTGQGIGEINVMAALPNTVIEITPSITTRNGARPAGVPYQITLANPGDVYQIQFPQTSTADFSGTKIRSVPSPTSGCQPIAVVSATTWSAINCGSGTGGDNFYQQLFPTGAWGKEFMTSPLKKIVTNGLDLNPDIVRVYVKDPTTVVTKMENGTTTTLTGLNPTGNFYEYETYRGTKINADKPIQVMQFIKTQNCNAAGSPQTLSDPEMIALSATEQTINDISVYSAFGTAVPGGNSAITMNYINVVMKTANTGSFRINGNLPTAAFNPIPGTNYSYLKESILTSVSRLKADSGFNAIAYGFGSVESYGYNAGTNVKDLYQQIGVSTQYGIETTPSVCTGSPFRFKVSLPYCADSIQWDISSLPGAPAPLKQIYTTCVSDNNPATTGDPDSTTLAADGKLLYWYSLPSIYTVNTVGTYPITITVYSPNSDCGTVQDIDFELQVSDPPTGNFTWTPGGCVAEPYKFTETTPQTPKTTYKWWWDFGDPASGALNNDLTRNPSHTFSGPGTYNVRYASITTPGCLSDTITKQVIVAPLPTATLSVSNPVVCIGAASPSIKFTGIDGKPEYIFTYNIDDGTGPGPSFTALSAGGTATIPVSTAVAGTFRYNLLSIQNEVPAGTACKTTYSNVFVDVTVTPDAKITLTSAPVTNNQTVCINTPIANITYSVTGSGTGGSVTGLPAGVTGTYTGGLITITGIPAASGTFNYTVLTTGPCLTPTATGTITITDDASVALTSAVGTDNQTICINNAITNITYAIGGSGTGGSVTGLPAGVTGTYAGGVVTITGTPSVSGTFNYTVSTSGPCVKPTIAGKIVVNVDATISRTSAAGTDNQTICINVPITNITYAVGGSGTGGSVAGLPAGVTGTYAGGVITITGAPSVSGTFNYTVSTTGPCVKPGATGTITVNPDATITLTSAPATNAQELCFNGTIANITYAIAGGGSGATVTGLPAGVTGVYAGGNFTISGIPTASGTFNYSVNTTGICVQALATGTIIVNALPTNNFNFTAPSCETRKIDFTDISTPNSGALNSWTWNFGDPPSGPNNTSPAQNPSHTYATPGTYTVSLIVTTDKGCTSVGPTKQLTINNRPLAGYIIPEVCLNDVAALFTDTSKVAAPDNIANWKWDFGDPISGPANSSTNQNPLHTYTSTGAYVIELIAFSNKGCTDTIKQNLFVNGSTPVANFTLNNAAALCANDSVSIVEASSVSPGSITKVEIYWDNVGQPAVFTTDDFPVTGKVYKHKYPNFQFPPVSKAYTIRYRAYSGGICVDDKIQPITVYAAPKVQFNNMPDVCLDATPFQITQASELSGVVGNPNYTGPGVSPTGIFDPASVGPGTYTIKYTYTATAGGCSDTLSKTITVLDSASAQFTIPPLVCEKTTASFNSTISTIPAGAGTITGWTWDFGDPTSGANNTSTSPNPTHQFTGWGNYNVKLFVTTSNGCKSTVRTIPVLVSPIARPNFAIPPTACLPSANITFNNSSTIPDGTQASFTYLWNFGDPGSGILNSSTGSSPSHIYNAVGPYNVNLIVTSGAGCPHDTTIVLNTIHPEPKGSFTVDKTDVCIGQGITFTDNSDPADGTTVSRTWTMDDGSTRSAASFTYLYGAPKDYNVSLFITNSFGCKSSTATKLVSVNAYPVVSAGPDLFILQGGSDTLEPIITATNPTYLWTPNTYFQSSNTIKNAIVKGVEDITYTLEVTGKGDCKSTDQVFIKVLKGPEIPNIFSPNGDGIHDTWVIKYLDTYPEGTVDIFNRYGQLIFHVVNYSVPWDGTVNGKPVPVGTYYYIVNPKNGRAQMSGYVDVIR